MKVYSQQLLQMHLLLEINELQVQIQQIKELMASKCHIKKESVQKRRITRWTEEEDQLLIDQMHAAGTQNYKQIQIVTKSASQVYFRLRYLKNVFLQNKELYLNKTDLGKLKDIFSEQ
ncbi:SANT/Myb_domain [Hexamita inflata]|uniref:SANT/Myb domain n=1 Tax=Hexamita inflata TaxID=28002 RepID=A0AA86PZJ9_9EUKA|nr:SANT/Myb domain [Hexamita inflata]